MVWIDRGRWGFVCALLALGGCSVVVPRSSPLPTDGLTMVQVYRNHMETQAGGTSSASAVRERLPLRPVNDGTDSAPERGCVSTLASPLEQRFARLPNPDLKLHVFPHLAKGRYPVPGYVTVFAMYEQVNYALPGEVSAHASVNSGVANAGEASCPLR
jgi:conjugative transfer region lipoprotein (TIGR03751 family)